MLADEESRKLGWVPYVMDFSFEESLRFAAAVSVATDFDDLPSGSRTQQTPLIARSACNTAGVGEPLHTARLRKSEGWIATRNIGVGRRSGSIKFS